MSTLNLPARSPGLPRNLVIGIVAAVLGLAGIVLLVTIVFAEPPASTPTGTVHRFLTAVQKGEYNQAYVYLSDSIPGKPDAEGFSRRLAYYGMSNLREQWSVDTEKVEGDHATVVVKYSFDGSGSTVGPASRTESFVLKLENGAWRITDLASRFISTAPAK